MLPGRTQHRHAVREEYKTRGWGQERAGARRAGWGQEGWLGALGLDFGVCLELVKPLLQEVVVGPELSEWAQL